MNPTTALTPLRLALTGVTLLSLPSLMTANTLAGQLQQAERTIEEVDASRSASTNEVLSTPPPTTPVVRAADVVIDLTPATGVTSLVTASEETISVDFPDEDVRNIIRSVADLYDLNVVIPESLIGRVSLKLRNVTWRQVFRVVLEPLNFTWVEDDNIIKIRHRDELMTEPVATRVYAVNFARAGDIQSALAPLVNTQLGGRIQVDARSNSLIITERPSRMNEIQLIIERLDRPTEQVMIESKFIEITQRDQRNLGVDWTSLSGVSLNAGPFNRTFSRDNNRETADSLTGSNTVTSDGINQARQLASGATSSTDFGSSISRLDTAVFSASAFNMVLSALQTNNDIQLVSNPTVVTLNNAPAQINIGEEFPVPRYTFNNERGTFEVSGFEFKPIGIMLQVTPQINSAGFINLRIMPEISSRTGEVNFGGAGGAAIPIVTTRRTESTVTIKDGYTLAIGGLIESTSGTRTSKVPVLGSVPLMGRLFSSESRGTDARNLVVFITAKILSADGSTYRDVFSPRTLFEMGIRESDIPGMARRTEEDAIFEQLMETRDSMERLQMQQRLRAQLQQMEALKERQVQQMEADPSEARPLPRRFQ